MLELAIDQVNGMNKVTCNNYAGGLLPLANDRVMDRRKLTYYEEKIATGAKRK